MEQIRLSVEFRMPDIPANVTKQEMEAMKQVHMMYPSRVLKAVMDMVMTDGIEVVASQIQRSSDIHIKTDIKIPDIRH